MDERTDLRDTFELAAAHYHEARPRYPVALFHALAQLAGLEAQAEILEVGPATGVATEQLARMGHRLTCIELGADLAHAARRNLARFPAVSVINDSFDTWDPPSWGSFDLVFAATSWHWLDPRTKYERAHRHLRPKGTLAFWSATHVVPDDGDPFFAELQDVYDEIGESLPGEYVFPPPGQLPDAGQEITRTGLFEVVGTEQFDWETVYDASAYIALLKTFSGHIAMDQWKQNRLHGEIRRRLAARPEGILRRHWGAVLHGARRLERPTR